MTVRLILLDLISTVRQPGAAKLAALDDGDWAELNALAQLHRLQPLLHRRADGLLHIPANIRETWREAFRQAAMAALMHDAALRQCLALLAGHGIDGVALKGAYLSRHAYPEAALRPMRDLDILVPEAQAIPAFQLLEHAGYRMAKPLAASLEVYLRLEVHMPVLIAPSGVLIELHSRLSEPDGKLEYATPAIDTHAVLAGASVIDAVRYPAPDAMLDHLIQHAIYGHRLDCGPLLLTDILYLAQRHPIDWQAFWERAARGGWQDGARLVVALVRDYHGSHAVPACSNEPHGPPAAIMELARGLLVQDYRSKKAARFIGTLLSGALGTIAARITGRVKGGGDAGIRMDRSCDGGWLRWAWSQTRLIAGELSSRAVRQQARDLARFRRWLQG